jgi:hypothetical protein
MRVELKPRFEVSPKVFNGRLSINGTAKTLDFMGNIKSKAIKNIVLFISKNSDLKISENKVPSL